MADLNDLQAAGATKIVGSDSTGLETNAVGADSNGNLQVINASDGSVTPGTIASKSSLAGAQYNTALPTLTNTQQSALQIDSSGRLIVSPTTQGVLAEDHNYGTVGANTLRVASQIGNATGAAAFGAGTTGAQTLRVEANQGTAGSAAWLTTDAADGSVTPGTVASKSMLAGGQYNTSLPTLTNTQQSALQLDSRGRLITNGINGFDVFTGSISALNGTVIASGNIYQTYGILVTGGWSGVLVAEESFDNSNWFTSYTYDASQGYVYASITGNNSVRTPGGVPYFRIRAAVWTSGTANVTIVGNQAVSVVEVVQPSGASLQTVSKISDSSGNNLYADFGSSINGLRVAAILGNASGTAAFGAGTVGAQTLRVVLPTDQSAIPVTQSGTWTVQPGNTANTTPWLVTDSSDGSVVAGTAATKSSLAGLVFNTALPTLTNGQQSAVQGDSSGRLIVAPLTNSSVVKAQLQDNAGTAITLGQKTMSASVPVVIASDQSVVPVAGNVASGATDSGNPVKVGGVFNTTLPVLTNGQRGDLQVDANGRLIILQPTKATYGANIAALVAANTPTDVFTITGSASKTISITAIRFSGTQTTSGTANVLLIKRSAANTGGTSTTPTVVPYDSSDPAGTAVIRAYTANPTGLGAAVGTIRSDKVFVALTTVDSNNIEWTFGEGTSAKPIVLRGTAQVLAINLNSVTITGNSLNICIEWTEE